LDDQAILDAIRMNQAVAAEAIESLPPPPGSDRPRTAAALNGAAAILGVDPAEYLLDQLGIDGQVTEFVGALRARGVRIEEEEIEDQDGNFPMDALAAFLPRAKSFRCRILKNGSVAGSGVLVGPRLVLTSWHVIAVAAPGQEQVPTPTLSVLLGDSTVQPATVPPAWFSETGDGEFNQIPPVRDADVTDRFDVALLAMTQPAGARLGFVELKSPGPQPKSGAALAVVHFPQGVDVGVGFGKAGKIRNVTSRWRYNPTTSGGSSGGGIFNRDLDFIGVHQGNYDNGKRFVPAEMFVDQVLERVKLDVTPPKLWSLDGTTTGKLVVGRDLFFQTIAAAGETNKRVRGIKIKRRALGPATAGLAFSHDILDQLLILRGPSHVLVRVSQDEIVPDLVAEIRRRTQAKGLDVLEPEGEPGVAPGQAPPETTAKDRASVLAASIEAAALKTDQVVWFFFDNPGVILSEGARLAFEGFVDAALVQPHLRLVIAGFETVLLAGEEFAAPTAAEGEGMPGLVVEFLGGFQRADLLKFLTEATNDVPMKGPAIQALIDYAVSRALIGIEGVNGAYTDDQLAVVTDRLRADLQILRAVPPSP